jgi:nucleoid DNA-binding protein
LIIEYCAKGYEARITGFGTFKSTVVKGRKLNTPIMSGGSVSYGDTKVLRFHQSPICKEKVRNG